MLGVIVGDTSNRGDRALAAALAQALPTSRLEPYLFAGKERWLARIGLSGRSCFDGVVVGGGTLLNDMAFHPAACAHRQGLPLWIMGTGAGRGSYQLEQEPDMSGWRPLLHHCEAVTVRGPVSINRLRAAGFTSATVLGDTALVFTPDRLPPPGDPRQVAVNVIAPNRSPNPEDWQEEHLGGLVASLQRLRAAGCTFRPFAMYPTDQEITRRVLVTAGVPDPRVFLPSDHFTLRSYLDGCGLAISMRLHGAVLAAAWGIPVLQVAYMEKAEDFARSLGLERQLVPVKAADEPTLRRMLGRIREHGEEGRRRMWEGALAARRRIEALGAEIEQRVRRTSPQQA